MAARPWTRLEHSLLLLDYLHHVFGAKSFLELKQKLGDYPEGFEADGRSPLARRLGELPGSRLNRADLESYDDNLKRHLDRLNAARPPSDRITLKYFQHLALLYTEYVLHRAFLDRDNFLTDLNGHVATKNREINNPDHHFPPFESDDLNKLAYWMATGSGKTLLLHINYYQILHYLALARQPEFDNILLITPNSGLSQQHLEEFAKSGIPAGRFQGSGLGRLERQAVQILEITKLSTAAAGPNTVHVDSFEGNNLVFVDEGHRGASGEVWLEIRNRLANQGFTFEYSATFGEALNGGKKPEDYSRRQSYGKAIVFDYSYKYFHGDGYGKDYRILNLPESFGQDTPHVLLLGNLLTFYEQMRLFDEAGPSLGSYHLERPLLIFVGHTVTTGKRRTDLTQEDKISLSDVLELVKFLQRVATNPNNWAVNTLAALLRGVTSLQDKDGRDVFAGKFEMLKNITPPLAPAQLYSDLLNRLFHVPSSGALRLANLRNVPGEIGLRAGGSDRFFGVINIGDDANFIKMAEEANLGLATEEEALRGSLFTLINRADSPVTMLLGAKKFTEGWSSWRVSGMGLLNVGRTEGSEIIQMFGRGVRLKGYNFSLKRSNALDGSHPPHLETLETLNIFSINGDYLSSFKNALEREGIAEGFEEIPVPVEYPLYEAEGQTFGSHTLYTIRIREDQEFADQPAFPLEALDEPLYRPAIDLRPQVQTLSSTAETALAAQNQMPEKFTADGLALLNWSNLTTEMLAWKRQRGFYNMVIEQATLQAILDPERDCYALYAPLGYIDPRQFKRFTETARLQSVALTILKQYAERFYRQKQVEWEQPNLEYRPLNLADNNLRLSTLPDERPGYIIKISRNNPNLIKQVEQLLAAGREVYEQDTKTLPNIHFDHHLYLPLFSAKGFNSKNEPLSGNPDFKFVPAGLVESETRFVLKLRAFLELMPEYLGQRHLYLLRNLSRGKGIGFFEAGNFYPDFMLWLIGENQQRLIFVDPKGLALIKPNDFTHPKIRFAAEIKTIEARLGRSDITLDSFIISDKAFAEASFTFGTGHHQRREFEENHILFFDDLDLFRKLLGRS